MNIDRDFILKEFKNETADNLADVERAVLSLEAPQERAQAAKTIMRKLHNIKGGASVLGFDDLGKLAHALEDCLEPLREGKLVPSKDLVRALLASVDLLKRAVEAALAETTIPADESERVLVQLARLVAGAPAEQAAESTAAAPAAPSDAGPAEIDRIETVRVEIDKLDSLLDLVTELTAAQGRVTQLAVDRAAGSAILPAAQAVTTLQRELQERFMRLRLVRIGPLLHSFERPAYQIADRYGKQVQLMIEGEDTEVDVSVYTLLRDPLTHIIRNAIDHGLEAPAARQAAGKPPAGTIRIKAAHVAGAFVVEIEDDGRGLDRAKILARAKENGLIGADEQPGPEAIDELVFLPGFSTAEAVSELSGRGVGMDVVRRNVESLRGTVSLHSRPGHGTTVAIRLPLTLAIMDGFVVQAGREHFVVPLGHVVEVLEHDAGGDAATGVFNLRGEATPYVRLARFYGEDRAQGRENIVVVDYDEHRFGIVVERLLGEMQVVIKPLNRVFERLPGISGTTILGDGRVALLLGLDLLWSSVLNAVRTENEE